MNIYKTISTEDQVGMIEIVTNSSTTADIHKNKGRGAITGAFENSTFYKFLKENNPTDEVYLFIFNLLIFLPFLIRNMSFAKKISCTHVLDTVWQPIF